MSDPLRLLLLEDSPTDAELNERALRKAGIEFTSLRVETQAGFIAALDEFRPDLILADFHLPGFNGLEMLALAREKAPDTPYLFVSGTMGEELAVEAIKLGAADYILKDRLARLPVAVRRALQEKAQQIQRGQAEARYRQLFETISSGVAVYRPEGDGEKFTFQSLNRAAEAIDHLRREDLIGHDLEEIFPAVNDFGLLEVLRRVSRTGVAEHLPPTHYQDARISGWRENHVYRLDTGEVVAVYDDVSERVEREAQLRRLNRILRTISACNQSLVRARSEADLLHALCRDIVEVGGYFLAWVACPDAAKEGAPLAAVAHYGDADAFQTHADLERDPAHARHCLTQLAMRERRAVSCKHLSKDDECGFGRLYEAGVQSILALPLPAGAQILGVLTIFSVNPDAFDAAEISLMEELAADLAYGIAALRTGEERNHYQNQFHAAMRNTVAAIARTLEMRDPYTAGHQQRVTALALAIAREMGLAENLIEGLAFGAMIHDIGKIAVPAEILAKPTRLSEIEYRLIQGHPDTGHSIVQNIDFPWPVAAMIVQHHERLDGSGYPHAIKGEAISLEARIVAVADVVEAMSAHRPYRVGLGMEAAIAEIEQGSGRQFDPAVVAACVKVVRENGMKLPE